MSSSAFAKDIISVVIDECHCIEQWGQEFHISYGKLDHIRSLVPRGVPFFAATATMTPSALKSVMRVLLMTPNRTYILNRAQDRPNITPGVIHMRGGVKAELQYLNFVVQGNRRSDGTIKKTIIFVNEIKHTWLILNHLRSLIPRDEHHFLTTYHSDRDLASRRYDMELFRQGQICVLIATEAAGMVS